MRWIGVDPGGARVGIAVCDENELIAVPVEIVPASVAVPAIRTIALREHAGGVVIGLPISLDGTERASAALARKLGERVRRVLGLEVEYEDERMSSRAVERAAGRAKPSDDLAAAFVLQQFIDRRRFESAHAALDEER
jgi:putative Holliday junction resolvase